MMGELYNITSSEGMHFEYQTAGVFSRAVAWMVDVLLSIICSYIITSIFITLFGFLSSDVTTAMRIIGAFIVNWGYFILCEWLWGGYTVGKRIVGIRVLDALGREISLQQAFLRNMVRLLDMLPLLYGVGGLIALIDHHHRRIGDILAGTIVIYSYQERWLSPLEHYRFAHNSYGNDPVLRKLIKTMFSYDELEFFSEVIRKRDYLEPQQRSYLFSGIAQLLKDKLNVEIPDHLSHENFVLSMYALMVLD